MSSLPTFFTPEVASVREGTPGRSRRLIDRRNELMCNRFYYYQKIKHYHFQKCVESLHEEFFLSQTEITKILRSMAEYLGELRGNQPAIKTLKELAPWMRWD